MSDTSGDPAGEPRPAGGGVRDRRPVQNPAGIALIVIGVLAVVVGAIMWGVGVHQAASDQFSAEYAHAIGLDNGLNMPIGMSPVDADNAMIWWGIALVVLGVLMLVARLVIAAAKPRPASAGQYRPTRSERMTERSREADR